VRDRTESFETIAAIWDDRFNLTNDGAPERLWTGQITKEFFSILGGRAVAGRLFTPDDFAADAEKVAVVSYGIWQSRWGRDQGIVGRTLTLNGEPVTVVGVLSPVFTSPEALVRDELDLWVPLDLTDSQYQNRRLFILGPVARLKPGVTLAAAQAEIDALAEALAEEYPRGNRDHDGNILYFPLVELQEATVGEIAHTLYVLLGAVGLMLLIACANVANLFLARGTDREREMAMRAALGASRGRIVGHLLTESVVLAVIGGAFGVALALAGVKAFELYNPGGIPRVSEVSVDWRVLVFAIVLSTLTGVLFGILPALQSAKTDVTHALKEGAHSTTTGRRRLALRNGLVVTEIGLALVLLVGAGLLFNSFLRLRGVDPGFDPDDLMVINLQLGETLNPEKNRYSQEGVRFAFIRDLLESLRAMPGVEGAAGTAAMPFRGGRCCWRSTLIEPTADDSVTAWFHPVTEDYFETLGARLVDGRSITASDNLKGLAEESTVRRTVPVVLSARLAQRYWPNQTALGRTLHLRASYNAVFTVVGVVDNMRHFKLRDPAQHDVYIPHAFATSWLELFSMAVRSRSDREALLGAVQQAIWRIDPNLPVEPPTTMNERLANSIAAPRFYSMLLATFATVAFLLAAGGIYGTMLYSVGQRHRELGIRLALGAKTRDLVGMVLGKGLVLTTIGIAFGVGGALGLSRLLESLVFGITTTDPTTIATVASLLSAVALGASYLPARKAAHADPLEALRSD
jgi:putative ABC transport system permease protein